MPVQSAICSAVATITRTVTVAAGVFAPGHLGELTQVISFDLVDAVLADTGREQRRVRVLPARVVVYFVLAMALFGEVSYRAVWAKLAEGLEPLPVAVPSPSALRQARRRVGPQPLRALFEMLAVPLAGPRVPGVLWRGLRPVAFDGTVISAADSAANEATFGRQGVRNGQVGYPLLRVMTLVECGTRSVLAAVFGSRDHGEVSYAHTLVDQLKPTMIVLMDKMFGTNAMLADVAGKAEFLCRLKINRNTPVCERYGDGSFLSSLGGVPVRIIEATIVCTRDDGTTIRGHYRLATTVTDHRRYPAAELVDLYHERWEIETTYLAIKHTLLGGRVLRSHHPSDVDQELWALLAVHQALRIIMCDTAAATPGVDPDRTSITIAFETARDQLTRVANILAEATLEHTKIGRNVINNLHPRRRRRQSPHAVKRPTSRYAYNDLGVPKTSHTYSLDIHITQPP